MQCPSNGLIYNTTQCACKPGYLLNPLNQSCILFSSLGELEVDSGVDYSTLFTFPAEALFPFDSLKRFTQSQAVFLEATLFVLLTWLVFCFVLRTLVPLGDGRSFGFRLRWWISRLDVCFSTHHWLEDREVVKKRKTEIGGAFSMASWMLFIGLFAALLYQIISKRTVEVHNVRASNAPDLATFINDMEFNITTISSMTCSNLRGLQTVAIGYPGSIEHRSAPLSTFAKYSCVNTTKGPTISLRCNNCQPLRDVAYVSWYFIDLPNNPASAVGFQFNLTARNRAHEKHLSFVRGTLKNGSNEIEKTITFRGQVPNILKFNLFPRIYHNIHELKLIQPLFHEFLPGSYFSEPNELQASLQSAADGLINTTLYINFLSDYIVEIDSQNIFGTECSELSRRSRWPVQFQYWNFLFPFGTKLMMITPLLESSTIDFLHINLSLTPMPAIRCEYRVKKLRNEDSVMRRVRNSRKAQDRWVKLRKYVMYTWGPCSLDDEYSRVNNDTCCGVVTVKSSDKNGALEKGKQQSRMNGIRFSKKTNLPSHKALGSMPVQEDEIKDETTGSHFTDVFHDQKCFKANDLVLPPPPSLEQRNPNEIKASDLQNDLQKLYEYNVMLSEKLVAAQSLIDAILKESKEESKEESRSAIPSSPTRK